MGVDPGYGITGYGVLEVSGNRVSHIDHGIISTPKDLDLPKRLSILFEKFEKLLDEIKPDLVAVEKLYFVKNVTTALEVGHARGVILLSVARKGIEVFECAPQQVKISVSGYGLAKKRQVQEMVSRLLGLPEVPKPDDAADALAIAWCASLYGKGERSWI